MSQVTVKTHYSAGELAAMQLPGMPGTRRGWEKLTGKGAWPCIQTPSRGRGGIRKEYAPPAEVMEAIRAKAAAALASTMQVATISNAVALPTRTVVAETDSQRLTADARQGVLKAIERIMQDTGYTLKRAAGVLVEMAQKGQANDQIVATLKLARDKRGRQSVDGLPSPRSLLRFVEYEKSGALAPKKRERDMSVPAWANAFMAEYQTPEKPTVAHAFEQFAKNYQGEIPSIHQVRRFLDKVGAVAVEVGRMGPRELKSLKPFVRRRFEHLLPTDIYTADGHTFDAEVQHPNHGKAFRPEITTVISISTRKAVGWSCGLSESALAVLDALRHAVETHGIPAIFYVDNGSGYKNDMMTNPATGFMSRLGIEMINSLPYSSQSRGVIERSQNTIWVKAAKELPGYVGKDMDREARLNVFKLSRAAIKKGGAMPLIGWNDFIRFCGEKIEEYNDRPHRSLPKITCTASGRRRHMTPNEAWALAVHNGFEPHTVSDAEIRPLFRPQVLRTVHRCELEVFGNRYFSKYLEEFHGEQLRIGYDIHKPECVWVYDADGRFLTTAEFEANKRDYFPRSVIEQARDKRALGREKRLLVKLDEVHAERHGAPAIEQAETVVMPGFMTITRQQLQQRAEMAELVDANDIAQEPILDAMPDPIPETAPWSVPETPDARWAEWTRLQSREEEITDERQLRWLDMYQQTAEHRMYSKKQALG